MGEISIFPEIHAEEMAVLVGSKAGAGRVVVALVVIAPEGNKPRCWPSAEE